MSTETTPSSGSSTPPLDLEAIEETWTDEWEYGVEYNNSGHVNPHSEKFAREVTQDRNDLTLVQRIKAIPAGPWQPVPPSTTAWFCTRCGTDCERHRPTDTTKED